MLGVKLNVEMVRLPAEMFSQQGRHFRIVAGDPIAPADLQCFGSLREQVAEVRRKAYSLQKARCGVEERLICLSLYRPGFGRESSQAAFSCAQRSGEGPRGGSAKGYDIKRRTNESDHRARRAGAARGRTDARAQGARHEEGGQRNLSFYGGRVPRADARGGTALREEAFRAAGGGTGEEVDIDAEDLAPDGYCQLIVWDPAAREIVGGYRFIVCASEHPRHLSTEHYFRFSDRFRSEYLPRTIELGRSFVQRAYQARQNPKSLYALDNLWDGLGALIVLNPGVKYLFGKVTMYTTYKAVARNALIWFLRRYFPDREGLVEGIRPFAARPRRPLLRGALHGQELHGELPDSDPHDPRVQRAHPAADQRLHESFAHDAGVRHGVESRFRRGRGDGHSGDHRRYLSRETRALHPLGGVAGRPEKYRRELFRERLRARYDRIARKRSV